MFVDCYRKYLTIINMLTNPWTSDKLIHYSLGGQAELAREFARIVCHFKTQQDASKEDENHVPERHEFHDKKSRHKLPISSKLRFHDVSREGLHYHRNFIFRVVAALYKVRCQHAKE
jgi:hypothetical protein